MKKMLLSSILVLSFSVAAEDQQAYRVNVSDGEHTHVYQFEPCPKTPQLSNRYLNWIEEECTKVQERPCIVQDVIPVVPTTIYDIYATECNYLWGELPYSSESYLWSDRYGTKSYLWSD